jgi:hypothetical protein
MNALGNSSLEILNLRQTNIDRHDMELIATSLYNEIENFKPGNTNLRVLNLSKNPITKEGAKLLA